MRGTYTSEGECFLGVFGLECHCVSRPCGLISIPTCITISELFFTLGIHCSCEVFLLEELPHTL